MWLFPPRSEAIEHCGTLRDVLTLVCMWPRDLSVHGSSVVLVSEARVYQADGSELMVLKMRPWGLMTGFLKLGVRSAHLSGRLSSWTVFQSLVLRTSLLGRSFSGASVFCGPELRSEPQETNVSHKETPPLRWRAAERRRP